MDHFRARRSRAALRSHGVSIVLALVGLVALVQGVAWLGPRRATPRPIRGGVLASGGLLLLGLSLLLGFVPDFF